MQDYATPEILRYPLQVGYQLYVLSLYFGQYLQFRLCPIKMALMKTNVFQEICLHTKLIAPIHCPIAEFLAKAPEPPPYMVTRNAVLLLKVTVAIAHSRGPTKNNGV